MKSEGFLSLGILGESIKFPQFLNKNWSNSFFLHIDTDNADISVTFITDDSVIHEL